MTAYKFVRNKNGEPLFFHKRFADNETQETIKKWKKDIEKVAQRNKINYATEEEFILKMKLQLAHSYYINHSSINVYQNEKIRLIKITSATEINYQEKIEKIEAEIEIENKNKTKYILTRR